MKADHQLVRTVDVHDRAGNFVGSKDGHAPSAHGHLVLAQSEINIAIGDKPPEKYFAELAAQCDGGKKKYGGITDEGDLRGNLRMSCVPEAMLDGAIPEYGDFLDERRRLMALKIKAWFEVL